jgi:hypothetical protein
MKILTDDFRGPATSGPPFVLTADSLSGPRPADRPPGGDVIGKQLNIIGAKDSTDMTQESPALYASVKPAGVVELGFNKRDAEGAHIYEQRDAAAGFTFLASETHSPYVDNRPLLVAGKPETRQYKVVFFLARLKSACPAPSSWRSPRREPCAPHRASE